MALLLPCQNSSLQEQTHISLINFCQKSFFTHSEENTGIDEKRNTFTEKDEPVIVVIHGGGLFTPKRIREIREEHVFSV